jgi:hypothetical protein
LQSLQALAITQVNKALAAVRAISAMSRDTRISV